MVGHDALIREWPRWPGVRGMAGNMKLYRIDKLTRLGGALVKRKHVLANSDKDAVRQAADSSDCPICDVVRDDGKSVGSIG